MVIIVVGIVAVLIIGYAIYGLIKWLNQDTV